MPNVESFKKLFNLKGDPKLIINRSTTSEKNKETLYWQKKIKKFLNLDFLKTIGILIKKTTLFTCRFEDKVQ